MIISVIGAQNTGKTTFISDFLKSFPHFTSPALDYRDLILTQNLNINREGDWRSQRIIMDFIIEDLKIQKASGKDVIIDRSVIDCYVYSEWLRNYKRNIHTEDLFDLYWDALSVIGMYDMFLFFPINMTPDINIEDDGLRDTDIDYRNQIDTIFHGALLSDYNHAINGKVISIGGNRDERIERVRPFIPFPACV